jgi:hypothetical protein
MTTVPMKRRGRPAGSRDTRLRANASAETRRRYAAESGLPEEFLPPVAGKPVTVSRPVTERTEDHDDDGLAAWARKLVTSSAFRGGIEKAAATGKLSHKQFEWLLMMAQRQQEKKTGPSILSYTTPFEGWILLNVSNRAQGREEVPYRLPGAPRDVMLAEMIDFTVEALNRGRGRGLIRG